MKKSFLTVISLGMVLSLLLNFAGCVTLGGESPVISRSQAMHIGDWSLEVIANGGVFGIRDKVDIQELLARDDVNMVLIDFWATWSTPSSRSIEYLQDAYYEYRFHGLSLLLINLDRQADKIDERIMKAIDNLGITAPVLWDHDSEVKSSLGIGAIPSVLLVDKQGYIRYERVGAVSSEVDLPPLLEAIEYLLEEG